MRPKYQKIVQIAQRNIYIFCQYIRNILSTLRKQLHRNVARQSLHCIQYKIVVVYSFGNKKWQQLSVTSHNQRYLQERNNIGSFYQLPFSNRFK